VFDSVIGIFRFLGLCSSCSSQEYCLSYMILTYFVSFLCIFIFAWSKVCLHLNMYFNVLILGFRQNIFWLNCEDLMIIEVNEPLIIDPWIIYNLFVLLISRNLVWNWVHVSGIGLNVHYCFSCSSFFLGFDPFLTQKIRVSF
jgi:hypothetical protein